MSRSVSCPADAEQVVFTHVEPDEDGENLLDDVTNLTYNLKAKFPSLYDDKKWVGHEDQALLANRYCRIGVSEYCGLVAVWIVTRDYDEKVGFALQWVDQISKSFKKIVNDTFGKTLRHIDTASNGEASYERI